MGVIPGSTSLSAPIVTLDAPPGLDGRLPGVEVFTAEIAALTTKTCSYRDLAIQVVMPNPPAFIPRVLNYVRANVCSGADPWDHLRLHLSVSFYSENCFRNYWLVNLGFGFGFGLVMGLVGFIKLIFSGFCVTMNAIHCN